MGVELLPNNSTHTHTRFIQIFANANFDASKLLTWARCHFNSAPHKKSPGCPYLQRWERGRVPAVQMWDLPLLRHTGNGWGSGAPPTWGGSCRLYLWHSQRVKMCLILTPSENLLPKSMLPLQRLWDLQLTECTTSQLLFENYESRR